MSDYEVNGPLAVIKDEGGKAHYYYHGALVPSGTPDDELKRLEGRGLIRAVGVKPAQPADPKPAALNRPVLTAPHEEWVAYTVSKGMARDKAEKMSKRELIDAYPPE